MKSVKNWIVLSAVATLFGGIFASAALAENQGTTLRLEKPLEIGATTLQPGVYQIKVLPGSGRHELQVTNEDGSKTITTVLAVPHAMVTAEQRRAQYVYFPASTGAGQVLRSFFAADASLGGGYDIVYPATRAGQLAILAKEPVFAYGSETTSGNWKTAELQVIAPDKKVTVYVAPKDHDMPMKAEASTSASKDHNSMDHNSMDHNSMDHNNMDPQADRDRTAESDRNADRVAADRAAADRAAADYEADRDRNASRPQLPGTASRIPLMAALGVLLLLAGGALRLFRAV